MDTKKWGPGGWVFLHSIAFNFPDSPTQDDKQRYYSFFTQVGYMLPCKYCRQSYQKFLKEYPIDGTVLSSRKKFSFWFYWIHCLVNNKLRNQGKAIPPNPSFEAVCNYYRTFVATCSDRTLTCTAPNSFSH